MPFTKLEDKDPDALNMDYVIDFSNYLQAGENIQTITTVFTSDASVTIDSTAITGSGTSITIRLSGGVVGTSVNVTARFVTTSGRGDDRSFCINIKEK